GKRINESYQRSERCVCVGPHCLLTRSQLLDVTSGKTLLGEPRMESLPKRTFFDLSEDEQYALAVGIKDEFELWHVPGNTVSRIDTAEFGQASTDCFLPSGEIVVGTENGKALLLAAPS